MNARNQQRSQAIVTAVASFMLLLGFCGPVRSAERNTLAHDLRAAVKLSAHSATRAEAFRALQDLQHRDSRVTYIHGLLLVERYRYPQGLQAINRAIESDKGNLTAWKTRIWLEVVTKDYDKALGTMESLSQLMQTSSAEAKCRDYCNFMGQVFGYLEGPGQKRAFVRKVADAEKRIVGGLSKTRHNVFETARAGIASDYSHRNNQIAQLLDTARSNQAESRKSQIADLATEGKGATTELARVEDRREVVRNLATAERNEIAATRDKSYHGSGAMGGVVHATTLDARDQPKVSAQLGANSADASQHGMLIASSRHATHPVVMGAQSTRHDILHSSGRTPWPASDFTEFNGFLKADLTLTPTQRLIAFASFSGIDDAGRTDRLGQGDIRWYDNSMMVTYLRWLYEPAKSSCAVPSRRHRQIHLPWEYLG